MCKRVDMRMECPECGYPYSEAMYPLDPSVPHTDSPTIRAELSDFFTEDELGVIISALYELLGTKQEALATLNNAFKPGGRDWTPLDFGIPQIEKLIEKIG